VSVRVRCELGRGRAQARALRARASRFLAELGCPRAELSLLIVGDAGMRRLNRRWRHRDRPTDVLSFPLSEPNDGPLLGDVVLSLDTAERRASAAGRRVGDELARYLAHGILHLLGYDHLRKKDARRMARAEARLVEEGLVASGGRKPSRRKGDRARRAGSAP